MVLCPLCPISTSINWFCPATQLARTQDSDEIRNRKEIHNVETYMVLCPLCPISTGIDWFCSDSQLIWATDIFKNLSRKEICNVEIYMVLRSLCLISPGIDRFWMVKLTSTPDAYERSQGRPLGKIINGLSIL